MTSRITAGLVLLGALFGWASDGSAQAARHYRFAYDQPKNTGYGIVGDIFASKLAELSRNTMLIDQYPGAQLGQEPQVLQLVKAGDLDFCISSSANAATLSPQSGVMSLHFLFKSEDHLKKSLADAGLTEAFRQMIDETVQGAHVIALATLGLRNMYAKREIKKIEDMKGLKVRSGNRHGGHDVPCVWRPDCAHAVRQRLHLAADGRCGRGGERSQCLSREQAL